MDMLLTAWNASRAIGHTSALNYAPILGENGYRIPVCEITKGKTVSPEQFKRVFTEVNQYFTYETYFSVQRYRSPGTMQSKLRPWMVSSYSS